MNQADLITELKSAMDRQKIVYRDLRALVLAFAAQESFIAKGQVSALAWKHHNPFGMKWNAATDKGRYESVELPGNAFDQKDGLPEIRYRVYDSFDQAVMVFLKNILASGNEQRRNAFEEFAAECADSWCKNNPAHVREVMNRFRKVRKEMEG